MGEYQVAGTSNYTINVDDASESACRTLGLNAGLLVQELVATDDWDDLVAAPGSRDVKL